MTEDLLRDDPVQLVVTESSRVFDGLVWGVRRESFELAGQSITREFLDHTGAVAVLALDEWGRALLIKQYRHPARVREWELPAGLLDTAGESPLAAAQRELAEEADVAAANWSVLSDFMTSPGGSNEAVRVYLARGISATSAIFTRTEEEAEIVTRWVPLDDIVQAVLARRVQNSILVVAALTAAASLARGWRSLGDADAPWPRHPAAG